MRKLERSPRAAASSLPPAAAQSSASKHANCASCSRAILLLFPFLMQTTDARQSHLTPTSAPRTNRT